MKMTKAQKVKKKIKDTSTHVYHLCIHPDKLLNSRSSSSERIATLSRLLESVIDDLGTPVIEIFCGIEMQSILSSSPGFSVVEIGYGVLDISTCEVHCMLDIDIDKSSIDLVYEGKKYHLVF